MKQRITVKDLENLTEEQKRRLNDLWTPSVYDAAIAKVIKNVATDEYDEYEFVISGISLYRTSIYLENMASGKAGPQSGPKAADTDMKKEAPEEDPAISIKVDPFFGESYPSFGTPEDFQRASEAIEDALPDEEDEDENEEPEEEFQEEDLEDNYQLPDSILKEDCTPLLTIGNMIEILQKNNFGHFDFFLSASTYTIGCELGRGESAWGNSPDWEPAELCDVLWESIKELL